LLSNLHKAIRALKAFRRSLFSCIAQAAILIAGTNISPQLISANHIASTAHNDSVKVARMTRDAINLLKAGHFDESRRIIDSIYQIAKKTGWEKKIGDCYFNYGQIERRRDNLDGFFENLEKSIQIYSNNKAWTEAARAHTSIAQVQVGLKKYQAAHQHFAQSLELREMTKDTVGITNNLINIGNLHYLEGNHSDASIFFFSALRHADDTGNKGLAAIALMNIGNVMMVQKKYEKSTEYLLKALQYQRDNKNRLEESKALHNLGIVYYELDDLAVAKTYFYEAKNIKEQLNTDLPGLVKIYNNLGLISKREGNISDAESYFISTLNMARQANDRHTEAALLNNLGTIKMDQKKPEALSFFLQSMEIAKGLGVRRIILSNYDNLQKYYSQAGDYHEAYYYAMQYQALDDSIYNDDSAAKIIELQTQYDTELKEKENKLLMAENRIRKQNQRYSIFVIVVLLFLLLSLSWAFFLKRKSLLQSRALLSREKELSQLKIQAVETQNQFLRESLFAEDEIKKLQMQSIEQKKAELTSSAMLIANKNEVFQKLRKLAEIIKAKESQESFSEARNIIAEIDRQTDFENQWEHFKIHFESLHKSFFDKLTQNGICLTQTDFQLCAYIKLNLSTKEISRLINIAPESVIKHRYRLRKKLKLPADQTLDDYVLGL
jgi:tetratricopeptide (TPR) repeat protein